MKRPLFVMSEIVDFAGNIDAAPAFAVEVLGMQYYDGKTQGVSITGLPITPPEGWVYTLSNMPDQFTMEMNLRKRPDKRVDFNVLLEWLRNYEYKKQ